MADLFAQHSVYIFDNTSNKHYVPFIYDGEKFIYCHTFIMNKIFTQFYTADREAFITADGDKFMVIGDGNVDIDTIATAYVGEAIAGYSIVGMR